jgi:hypothetical protein
MIASNASKQTPSRLADRLAAAQHGRFVGREVELELFRSALLADEFPFAVLHIYGPGGVVVFHELDLMACKSLPRCEVFETAVARINQTFTRAGADVQTGLKLAQIFIEAGLPRPEMIQAARLGHGPDSLGYKQVAELTRTLLPLMERVGVATADEVMVDTLAERLCQEVVANNATIVAPPYVGAWARLP